MRLYPKWQQPDGSAIGLLGPPDSTTAEAESIANFVERMHKLNTDGRGVIQLPRPWRFYQEEAAS